MKRGMLAVLLLGGCFDFSKFSNLMTQDAGPPDQFTDLGMEVSVPDLADRDASPDTVDAMDDAVVTEDFADGFVDASGVDFSRDMKDGSDDMPMPDLRDGGKDEGVKDMAGDGEDRFVPMPDLSDGGEDMTLGPPPKISAVMPAKGSNAGGAMLTVGGDNFVAGQGFTISLSGIPAPNVIVVDAKTATCTAPAVPGAFGPTLLKVTNPDGQSATSMAFSYYSSKPMFSAPSPNTCGQSPRDVALVDLNKDGKLDLVGTAAVSGDVCIFMGKGDGTFTPLPFAKAGTTPMSVIKGDFTSDGNLDLVVTNFGGGNVSLLVGAGDGTFMGPQNFAAGVMPYGIGAGDVNLDGNLDLVVTNAGAMAYATVLLGTGKGMFLAPTPYVINGSPSMHSVVVADFDQNGKPDIAAENESSGGASVLLNNGAGIFGAKTDYKASNVSPACVVSGDFDGNGLVDLAIGYGNGNGWNGVGILLSKGDGTFLQPAKLYDNAKGLGALAAPAIATTDIDGDGNPDIIIANSPGTGVSLLQGKGGNIFGWDIDGPFNVGGTANALATGDVNGDGRPDIVTANPGGNSLNVMLNVSQ